MSAARTIIDRAREAGLPAELTEQFERDLAPRLERLRVVCPGDAELGALIHAIVATILRSRDAAPDTAPDTEVAPTRPTRVPGGWRGRVRISEDFDAPLSEDIERGFYDTVLEPEQRG